MKTQAKETLWMAVTKDPYQLPLAVADSCQELAELMGSTYNNVRSVVSKGEHGRILHPGFVRVQMDAPKGGALDG